MRVWVRVGVRVGVGVGMGMGMGVGVGVGVGGCGCGCGWVKALGFRPCAVQRPQRCGGQADAWSGSATPTFKKTQKLAFSRDQSSPVQTANLEKVDVGMGHVELSKSR